jgi:hypothetical protein
MASVNPMHLNLEALVSFFRKPKRATVITVAAYLIVFGFGTPLLGRLLWQGGDEATFWPIVWGMYVGEAIVLCASGLLAVWRSRAYERQTARFDAILQALEDDPVELIDVSTRPCPRVFVLERDPSQSVSVERSRDGNVSMSAKGGIAEPLMRSAWGVATERLEAAKA